MARNVSDEELQLKKRARRRLVGAIVLVTAVAVVLPMILDSEPRPSSQDINIQIPSPDAGVLSAKPAPLKAPRKAAAPPPPAQSAAVPTPRPAPKALAVAKSKQEPKPAPKSQAVAPETKLAPKAVVKAKPAAATAGAFVIQVVALVDATRAKELQAKIAAGGLKSYTEVVRTEKGPVTRVRVGPYASREAAENGRQQLQRMELDGKVIPK